MLSLLLTGALLLQLKESRVLQGAYQHSIAATQLFSILERLKIVIPSYRQQVLSDWNQQNKILLPQAKGQYHCSNTCWAELSWGSQQHYHLILGR